MKSSARNNKLTFKSYGLLLALALAATLTFPFNDYTRQDINISQLNELWFLFGMHLMVCIVFFSLYYFTLTTKWGKLLATIGSVFILLQKFPRLFEILSAWTHSWSPTLNSLWITCLILLIFWAGARIVELGIQLWRPIWHKQIFTISLFICGSMVVLNGYSFLHYLVKQHQAYAYKPKNNFTNLKLPKNEGRDIYYFVFDRYASQQVLQKQFQYDNSPFLQALHDEGFMVRNEAVANYQYTAPSIASTVRMEYHTDMAKDLANHNSPSYMPYKAIIEDSPTKILLQQEGYSVYNYGNWWNVTRKQKNATNIIPYRIAFLGKYYNLSDLQGNGIQRTFLNNLLQRGIKKGPTTLLKLELASPRSLYLGQIDSLTALAKKRSSKPKFVFAHILNPHPPYVFGQDGGGVPYNDGENNIGTTRRDKYINQLEYANKTIETLMSTIKENATKPPIIIIQADEGPYPLNPIPAWQKASADNVQLKFGTLAAYHLPDTTADEAVQLNSSVNIFRFVFNRYFGTSLPYLPDCSLVFNNTDHPFRYYDITSKLHAESPDCKNYY